MQKGFALTPQMEDYYNSLPQSVKSAIVHSGAEINSLDELKAVAQELTGNEKS